MSASIYDNVNSVKTDEPDRGEWVETMVDIYDSADTVRAQDPTAETEDAVRAQDPTAETEDAVRGHEPSTETEDATPKSNPETQRSGPDSAGKGLSRLAAVCLGLLCVLLLAVIIVLIVYCTEVIDDNKVMYQNVSLCTNEKTQLQRERDQFQTSHTNLTEEKDELQTRYTNLTEKREQLQTRYTNLTEEREQLQTRYTNLTEEREQLQTRYTNLTEERNQLQKRLSELGLYYISNAKNTWNESRHDCRERGADLVIINSEEELKFVSEFKKVAWIGLTDHAEEKVWKWVDGSTLTTKYWNDGEPNDGASKWRTENCAVLRHDLKTWNDVSCTQTHHWICEKKLFH